MRCQALGHTVRVMQTWRRSTRGHRSGDLLCSAKPACQQASRSPPCQLPCECTCSACEGYCGGHGASHALVTSFKAGVEPKHIHKIMRQNFCFRTDSTASCWLPEAYLCSVAS